MEELIFPLDQIPVEGLRGSRVLEPSWFSLPEDADDPINPVILTRPVSVKFSIERAGRDLRVRLRVTTTARLTCARCIEAFSYPVEAEGTYVLTRFQEPKEELSAEDLDLVFIQGEEVDLSSLVYEQIVLTFPIKPLCSEQCLGMCPQCGANLNEEPCSCDREVIDPRWEALRKLRLS